MENEDNVLMPTYFVYTLDYYGHFDKSVSKSVLNPIEKVWFSNGVFSYATRDILFKYNFCDMIREYLRNEFLQEQEKLRDRLMVRIENILNENS